jgi:4-amino-4-deoxyprephenate dehydrogenase
MKILIIGALGKVGRLFFSHLQTIANEIVLVDIQAENNILQADAKNIGPSFKVAISDADIVVNCLPDSIATDCISAIADLLSPGSLLVDTLSVKGAYLAKIGSERSFECLSLNPLFAPDLGFSGQSIAAVKVFGGPRSTAFIELLQSWGSSIIEMSAQQHDEAMAIMQTGVHASLLAVGSLISRLPAAFIAKDIGTPPFQVMLLLLSRILTGNTHVYWDIQHVNLYAKSIRQTLASFLKELDEIAEEADEAAFKRRLECIRSAMAESLATRGEKCARLFSALPK